MTIQHGKNKTGLEFYVLNVGAMQRPQIFPTINCVCMGKLDLSKIGLGKKIYFELDYIK